MSALTTLVAPREIDDYVTWAARVCGCDPGLAGRIAAAVTFAELHYGGAVGVFVETFGEGLSDSDFALGPDMVMSGEIAARDRGIGKLVFGAPVRFAAIAKPLDDALTRGALCGDLPSSLGSRTEITALTLSKAPSGSSEAETIVNRRTEVAAKAYREGLPVDAAAWVALVDSAKGFRVSERVLDAAES